MRYSSSVVTAWLSLMTATTFVVVVSSNTISSSTTTVDNDVSSFSASRHQPLRGIKIIQHEEGTTTATTTTTTRRHNRNLQFRDRRSEFESSSSTNRIKMLLNKSNKNDQQDPSKTKLDYHVADADLGILTTSNQPMLNNEGHVDGDYRDRMLKPYDDYIPSSSCIGDENGLGDYFDACNFEDEAEGYYCLGRRSCRGVSACIDSAEEPGSSFIVGKDSCNGSEPCDRTGNSVTIGKNSCNGNESCQRVGVDGGDVTIGNRSCNGDEPCIDVGNDGGDVLIGRRSCNGDGACAGAGADGSRDTTIGEDSCNCDDCCLGLPAGSFVGDDECNSIDDGCSDRDDSITRGSTTSSSFSSSDIKISIPTCRDTTTSSKSTKSSKTTKSSSQESRRSRNRRRRRRSSSSSSSSSKSSKRRYL